MYLATVGDMLVNILRPTFSPSFLNFSKPVKLTINVAVRRICFLYTQERIGWNILKQNLY